MITTPINIPTLIEEISQCSTPMCNNNNYRTRGHEFDREWRKDMEELGKGLKWCKDST